MIYYCGIDPGSRGGLALIGNSGPSSYTIGTISFANKTETDIAETLRHYRDFECEDHIGFTVIEKVWGQPWDTPKTAGVLCQSYGFLRGLLVAFKIPFQEVPPSRWQQKLDCMTGGDKHVSKQRVESLYPEHRWTLGTADAGCIAEFCRIVYGNGRPRSYPPAHRKAQQGQMPRPGIAETEGLLP